MKNFLSVILTALCLIILFPSSVLAVETKSSTYKPDPNRKSSVFELKQSLKQYFDTKGYPDYVGGIYEIEYGERYYGSDCDSSFYVVVTLTSELEGAEAKRAVGEASAVSSDGYGYVAPQENSNISVLKGQVASIRSLVSNYWQIQFRYAKYSHNELSVIRNEINSNIMQYPGVVSVILNEEGNRVDVMVSDQEYSQYEAIFANMYGDKVAVQSRNHSKYSASELLKLWQTSKFPDDIGGAETRYEKFNVYIINPTEERKNEIRNMVLDLPVEFHEVNYSFEELYRIRKEITNELKGNQDFEGAYFLFQKNQVEVSFYEESISHEDLENFISNFNNQYGDRVFVTLMGLDESTTDVSEPSDSSSGQQGTITASEDIGDTKQNSDTAEQGEGAAPQIKADIIENGLILTDTISSGNLSDKWIVAVGIFLSLMFITGSAFYFRHRAARGKLMTDGTLAAESLVFSKKEVVKAIKELDLSPESAVFDSIIEDIKNQ